MLEGIKKSLYLRRVCRANDADAIAYGTTGSFERLLGDQIEDILGIVDREIERSYDFGLELDRDDVIKEKTVVLLALNVMAGGLVSITKYYTYEQARLVLGQLVFKGLDKELEKYFDRSVAQGKSVRNMYNCHLDAVLSEAIRAIYDHKIRYT